jgi:hypothetical protein
VCSDPSGILHHSPVRRAPREIASPAAFVARQSGCVNSTDCRIAPNRRGYISRGLRAERCRICKRVATGRASSQSLSKRFGDAPISAVDTVDSISRWRRFS